MDPSSFIGVIWDATKCFCGCAKQEADFIFDLEPNLQLLEAKRKKLEDKKKDVEAEIEEAENTGEMQRSHEVSGWLRRVEGIQLEIKDIQVHEAQEIQKKCLGKCPKNCRSSYKLGKEVAKMLQNVDELATEAKGLGKDSKIAHKVTHKAIEMPPDDTVGLDLMFDKVWNSVEEENVGVIGLYGMGGVGKTTLLKKINNELGKRMLEFNVVMWVVVSKELNLDSIMNNIRKLIGIRDDLWNDCSNQDEKAAKIYRILKQKKFVLFLDDMWESIDLKLVGVPHPKDTNFQSKVLFTTRVEDVCGRMQAQRTFKIKILTEKEALKLFCMKVGEETLMSHPNIPKLAEEMAMECKGLPLALIVVGSAMAGVKSVEAWKHLKNNLTSSSWIAPDLETKVFSILKFSYDRLSDEVHKKCFLYCALYPEDYEIHIFDLIDKWMGEGFLCGDQIKSVQNMRAYGEFVIEKLKLSCLLETNEDDIYIVKMHDVIRDLALWLARDEDKSKKKILVQGKAFGKSQDEIESWKAVERISIMNYDEADVPIPPYPNLTAFSLQGNFNKCLENIQYMSKLKVLEIESFNPLPVGIGGLYLLEYLSLTGVISTLEFFSIELKKLKNLKFLRLIRLTDDVNVASIPSGVISSLHQLRSLSIHHIKIDERELLDEIESLPKFEELSIVIKTDNGLNKLLESAKLQSYIYNLDLVVIYGPLFKMCLLLASMSKMQQLRCLLLCDLWGLEDSSIFDTCCLTMLQVVNIDGCHSLTHVTWLKYAPVLQQLFICYCNSMEEVIKEEGTKDDKGIENVNYLFSSLVTLYLRELPKLKSIHKTVLSFPALRSIEISLCTNLKKLPFDSNSAKHKLRRIKGKQDWWDNLEWDDPATKEKFQSKLQTSKGY